MSRRVDMILDICFLCFARDRPTARLAFLGSIGQRHRSLGDTANAVGFRLRTHH